MPRRELSTEHILAKPIDFDWSEGYGERWDMVYPDVDEWTDKECTEVYKDRFGDPDTDWTEDDLRERLKEKIKDEPSTYEPVMNYYYPLGEDAKCPSTMQSMLERVSTSCIVAQIDGKPVLVLAGGGMDFSWDICRAYIALGFYPPAHFAGRLPRMDGEYDVNTARICVEACKIAENWAKSNTQDARSVLKWAREQRAARAAKKKA